MEASVLHRSTSLMGGTPLHMASCWWKMTPIPRSEPRNMFITLVVIFVPHSLPYCS